MGLRRLFRNCIVRNNTIPLPEETVYRVLSASRRRHLLVILDDLDAESTQLGELAERVAAREADGSGFEASRISLYQSHLPLLDSLGVVEWDRETGAVSPQEPAAPLADMIREIRHRTM